MKRNIFIYLFSLIFVASGCVKNNPIPTWLEINSFTLVKNPSLNDAEGNLDNHGFSNGWVYINNKFIGIFELPCKVPVLTEGPAEVTVYPTILKNGVHQTKANYDFTDGYTTYVTFESNKTTTINPVAKYGAGTNFWIEDFEGNTIFLSNGNNTQTSIIRENISGNNVGRVLLNSNETYWAQYLIKGTDDAPFTFTLGTRVYLEFDIKSEVEVRTDITYIKQGNSVSSQPGYTITPSTNWKRMYIELSEVVNYTQGTAFWFGFAATLPEGSTQATILLDNIKIVSR